jgi:hypothetical protein
MHISLAHFNETNSKIIHLKNKTVVCTGPPHALFAMP